MEGQKTDWGKISTIETDLGKVHATYRDLVERVVNTRATHLDCLAMAFMAETGCKVEEIELVEKQGPSTICWIYRKREK